MILNHCKTIRSVIIPEISKLVSEISKLTSEISNKLNTTFLCCNYAVKDNSACR